MTYMTINYKDNSSCSGVIIVPNMPSVFSLDYVPQNIEDVSLVLMGCQAILLLAQTSSTTITTFFVYFSYSSHTFKLTKEIFS